jgi:hypothetical protein
MRTSRRASFLFFKPTSECFSFVAAAARLELGPEILIDVRQRRTLTPNFFLGNKACGATDDCLVPIPNSWTHSPSRFFRHRFVCSTALNLDSPTSSHCVDLILRIGPSNSPLIMTMAPRWAPAVGVLDLSTSMGGTRSKVKGGDQHDLEPEGTREDTRHEIYTGSGSRSSYPTSCLE